jgi:hypothetical protein
VSANAASDDNRIAAILANVAAVGNWIATGFASLTAFGFSTIAGIVNEQNLKADERYERDIRNNAAGAADARMERLKSRKDTILSKMQSGKPYKDALETAVRKFSKSQVEEDQLYVGLLENELLDRFDVTVVQKEGHAF